MVQNNQKTAVIIGGGPAGLTAALELLRRSDIRPIVLEASDCVGGISRTTNFNGYRMDLGGHRFFSKSDWVMDWWQSILPLEPMAEAQRHSIRLGYRNSQRGLGSLAAGNSADADGEHVMLLRDRLSRIYFNHKLFDYPISLNLRSISKLGFWRCLKIGASYARAKLFPRATERHLEDFLINRFGGELYRTFFQAYTEKVWGVPCDQLSAQWGAQRIKSVSLTGAVRHALRRFLPGAAKAAPTSLVERFLYPRLGPGQLWETVARQIRERGGEICFSQRAERIELVDGRANCVVARDVATGVATSIAADWVISTMAVSDLVACFHPPAPADVARIAAALPYRHFIVVGVLVTRMKRRPGSPFAPGTNRLPDNWIYVQEPDVKMGRLQIFNNWSPALVPDPDKVWLGVEYFCNDADEIWSLPDSAIQALAVRELEQIELVDSQDVVAATVVRVPKAYPAYFGSYAQFDTIRSFVDPIDNLFLVGRNGMHRYNNQDHSMLTAKAAVDIIVAGRGSKDAIWDVNVDDDYHESIND